MTKKKDASGRQKTSRGNRFSLRNILTSANLLVGGGNVNLPIPTSSGRGKEPFSGGRSRHKGGGDADQFELEGSELSDAVAVDCYIEPELLPNGLYECPLCYASVESFPEVESCAKHRACSECWKSYLRIQITESRVNLTCFQCSKPLHPNDIKSLAEPDLMSKYEDFMIRRVLSLEPDARWCPAPDCGFAVIAAGCASCPRLLCERPRCNTAFCYHCKQLWHANLTCDAARALRSFDNMEPLLSTHELRKRKVANGIREDIKPCPRCQVLIVKMDDGSCNHMACLCCGAEFCWLCMKQVSDLHYLSPSGCTFWGKKPWSRKKKLMWQLGTLIGAPVGIGLVAGIAVPAMIIGIPVWVGRKIHNKMKNSIRHRRHLAVTGGVVAAVVISPILAGLAVGLGVPILLAYVYGVVPVSLCRSGGCGLTPSSSGIEINKMVDEEGDSIPSGAIHGGYVRSSEYISSRADASIGEPSGVSLSGENNQRSESPDRESTTSMIALAGASLTGSVGSSHPPSHTKLEIQADVLPTSKRHSLSSETASVCLSMDDGRASTRGLAGSVLSYKETIEDTKSETSCQ